MGQKMSRIVISIICGLLLTSCVKLPAPELKSPCVANENPMEGLSNPCIKRPANSFVL